MQTMIYIPGWLTRVILFAGVVSMGFGPMWAVAATWLSAHRVITVIAELASFWLCVATVLLGGWCAFRASKGHLTRVSIGLITPALAVFVVVWGCFLSDAAFFRWKLKSVQANAWAQMVSDMRQIASPTPDGGYMPGSNTAPPMSVRELGLGDDYTGMNAWVESSSGYPGVRGDVLFGYKSRAWGLWLGPEESLDHFCPRCRRALVAPKALFFVGSRG